ncbi:hypothetical protein [Stieleria varia]|uniref:Uncharacterized protein n=1 Tax=Stieleria varia TaxID=2528005 RepID=A0A5C6B9M6_9BACT|nr:hypothetical protein [Stieleria varia]TWU07966.1 hypothetical protein Pla52n_05430 [Stieleria varia]
MSDDSERLLPSDPAGRPDNNAPRKSIPLGGGPVPAEAVPAFGCVVYVSRRDGRVQARVANLAGIAVDAESERSALGQVVRLFKASVVDHLADGGSIPWVDPPATMRPEEQKRFLPVHL